MTERITKDDILKLGDLALAYGKAKAEYAQTIERAHHEVVPPTRLVAFDGMEQNAWQKYADLHHALLKKLEGEEFDDLVAPLERPTIYTLRELDALPQGSVVIEEDESHTAFQKDGARWYGDDRSWEVGQIHLPVTVIFTPEES
jgi:hypothetical protein